MISIVRGTLVAKAGDVVTVMTPGGVGYELSVPVSVLEHLPAVGSDVQLDTVVVVREDSWSMYGFTGPTEREVFERLLQASGVGPRLALTLMSALGTERVIRALRQEDIAALCTVPGIGKKKAERMVLELRDRIRDLEASEETESLGAAPAQTIVALVNLGYSQADADAAVRAVLAGNAEAETGALLRGALQHLTTS